MKSCRAHFSCSRLRRSALTLLEMMVAVTLLAVIMVGLLAMFNQTQKALRVSNAQTDVFENARGAIQMIARDLSELTLYRDTNVIAFYATPFASQVAGGALPLTASNLPVFYTESFWLTRANDNWQGIGYFVAEDPVAEGLRANSGVGTLYRFSRSEREQDAIFLRTAFSTATTNYHRVSDGVVHLLLEAVFVETTRSRTNFVRARGFTLSNTLPAFVDVELGILEPATLKQFQSLKSVDAAAAQTFLRDHAGQIHFFRERVPIRNFVNPHRANEVL